MFWNEPFLRHPTRSLWAGAPRLQTLLHQLWPNAQHNDRCDPECAPGCCDEPELNVWRHDDLVRVALPLPGVAAESVELAVEQELVTVRGRRPAAEVMADRAATPATTSEAMPTEGAAERKTGLTTLRRERLTGEFERRLKLPFPVDAEKTKAWVKQGILWIDLPRVETDKPRKIEVRPAAE